LCFQQNARHMPAQGRLPASSTIRIAFADFPDKASAASAARTSAEPSASPPAAPRRLRIFGMRIVD
ncbi:hypothetical protein, partial [Salmonella sp. SAL04286]|uniref:hypothetical protein n=1 Tax=Salmonella sp. SAL04286 TaxID=3159864 RepID=UPI00397D0B16